MSNGSCDFGPRRKKVLWLKWEAGKRECDDSNDDSDDDEKKKKKKKK
jgi:hypothetical protein